MLIGNELGEEWILIGFVFKDVYVFDCWMCYVVNEGLMDRYIEYLCIILFFFFWFGVIRLLGW